MLGSTAKEEKGIDEGTEAHLKMSTIWEHCWLNTCNEKILMFSAFLSVPETSLAVVMSSFSSALLIFY